MTRWRPGVQRTPWNWAASSQTKPAHGNGLLQAPTTPPGTRALPGYNLSCFEVLCLCHKPSQKWTGPRSFSRPQRILTVDCLTLGWKKKKFHKLGKVRQLSCKPSGPGRAGTAWRSTCCFCPSTERRRRSLRTPRHTAAAAAAAAAAAR